MRDKRPVDELSIEELERILAIRKREERQKQLRRLDNEGRRLRTAVPAMSQAPVPEPTNQLVPAPDQPTPVIQEPERPLVPQPTGQQEAAVPRFEDDLEPLDSSSPQDQKHQRQFFKRVWNRSLLLVEVLAVVGILAIGAQMLKAVQVLQDETAAVQAEAQAQAFANLPTPTITPEITLSAIVLPGGHTPPTAGSASQFNYNEIPEHLRTIVRQQLTAEIPIPTPGPESPVRLEIPALGVDAPIVGGTHPEALKRGVGHQDNTGLPGQRGNVVLAAHNDIYGEIFRYLDQLNPNDEIIVHTLTQRYTYTVRDTQIVSPHDVWVMDPTYNPTTTLISCYPYQVDNQRIVVFAELTGN